MKERTKPVELPLGQVVATRGALAVIDLATIKNRLDRHSKGDWGDVPRRDTRANETAIVHGYRVISSYQSGAGVRFWIITEADRSQTTVLLPDEY